MGGCVGGYFSCQSFPRQYSRDISNYFAVGDNARPFCHVCVLADLIYENAWKWGAGRKIDTGLAIRWAPRISPLGARVHCLSAMHERARVHLNVSVAMLRCSVFVHYYKSRFEIFNFLKKKKKKTKCKFEMTNIN